MMSGEEVSALLARAAAGDQAAWDALVDGFASLLWAVARAHRLDDADCADAVQTAWLRLLENLERITEPDRLGAWLSTTVRRECLRVIRRSGREYVADADHLTAIPEPRAPEMGARLMLAERDAALWAAFERIPDRCRRLLRVLLADPAPSYQDVSAALEMPIGSIGPTRQRCLERLRRFAEANDMLSLDNLGGAST
ncbi:MAG TPA: sigma-70 family RNA polymerase sigma factor [Actinomycetes bacterium]|nr:sigma-70 family RNA polymerase sigma factor [Actinomycetes bacterium]